MEPALSVVSRHAKKKYIIEKIAPLLDSDSRKWHSVVKKMTRKSVSSELRMLKTDGTLISAQEVNSFFTEICTTYPSLSEVELNTLIKDFKCDEIKQVSRVRSLQGNMKTAKKPYFLSWRVASKIFA